MSKCDRRRILFASSSIVALLMSGMPHASAQSPSAAATLLETIRREPVRERTLVGLAPGAPSPNVAAPSTPQLVNTQPISGTTGIAVEGFSSFSGGISNSGGLTVSTFGIITAAT